MNGFSVRKLVIKNRKDIETELQRIGVDSSGVSVLAQKSQFYVLKAHGLKAPAANILKQEMLSLGADCATARGSINCSIKTSDVIMTGTEKQFVLLLDKIKNQPFKLKELACEIEQLFCSSEYQFSIMLANGKQMDFSKNTAIMGILNVTKDSFFDGGKYFQLDKAVGHAICLINEGADILDIGGESTRPGSKGITEEEELNRVLPVIEKLKKETNITISIDTRKSAVAKAAIDAGAVIVNDVSSGLYDSNMLNVVCELNVPIVLMHHQRIPETMQDNPNYEDLIKEVFQFFQNRIKTCVELGVSIKKVILDPGIGFGKRVHDNLNLIRNLGEFLSLGRPILLGASRKSFIGAILNSKIDDRKVASLAVAVLCAQNGAHILRVHDVSETKKAIQMVHAIDKLEHF